MSRRTSPWIALAAVVCLGCPPQEVETPEPGELRIGLSRVRMPAPVGIGTVGYGPIGAAANPTPFSEIFPGTKRVHGHPDFKAVALSRGPDFEVVFLRADTVGVFQQFRRAVVEELMARTGRDFEDILVIGGTHTHSGPGRVIDGGGLFNIIADTFFPEFYERMVEGMADAVEEAYADLRPARLGHAIAYAEDAHGDRRCEDGVDYTNSKAPLLVVERDGQIDAVLTSFAIHGTVLSIDDHTLSAEVHGAIEAAVEDRFERPVEVLAFNSWGADMSPASPPSRGEGATLPGGFDQMGAIGEVVADAVEIALSDVVWTDDPSIAMRTYRIPIDRASIGYASDEFQYEYGGVFCGSNHVADCDPETIAAGIDGQCMAFNDEYPAPRQTVISAGQVGDWHFVTWPGEPGTLLAESLIASLTTRDGVSDVLFLGYAQDYLGYSLAEDDWWQGGYEASGALWGPRQGEYLLARTAEVFDLYVTGAAARPADEPPQVVPFSAGEFSPREATTALTPGSVLVDVAAEVTPSDVVVFAVAGHDPWLGTPLARLVTEGGDPVARPGGKPLDSDTYAFWVDLEPEPSYRADEDAASRTFRWRFSLPVARAGAGRALSAGGYRIAVTLADGTEVPSGVFTVVDPG